MGGSMTYAHPPGHPGADASKRCRTLHPPAANRRAAHDAAHESATPADRGARMAASERDRLVEGWRRAVERAKGWAS